MDLNKKIVDDSSVIIIAVKPQDVSVLSGSLKSLIDPRKLLISIAAGISMKKLKTLLNHQKIVRVMPNTPALIKSGISGWIANKNVTDHEKKIVKKILSCLGKEIEFKKEDDINSVTALSGSGPAYFFYILESFIKISKDLGIKENIAKTLAIETMIGAAQLAKFSKDDLLTLRKNVTSKGGTTEKAIEVFEKKKMNKVFEEGIRKAYEKAKEISGS